VSLKSLSIPKKFYSGGKMRIAPIDIAHKNFSKKFMGFDSEEVIEFLREMADQMEELIRDRNSLKETLREKELNILEYRERDETLKATITTATKMAEQIRVDAEREAKLIMNDAQQKGEMIVKDARDSLKRIYQEVGEMKRARIQFEANLRSIAQAHLAMLDQSHQIMPDYTNQNMNWGMSQQPQQQQYMPQQNMNQVQTQNHMMTAAPLKQTPQANYNFEAQNSSQSISTGYIPNTQNQNHSQPQMNSNTNSNSTLNGTNKSNNDIAARPRTSRPTTGL
jgi:cell division initiation protein